MLWNNKISQTVFSSYNPQIKTKEEECLPSLNKYLLAEHEIETRVCLGKDLKAYSPELRELGGEYVYFCKNEAPLYFFSFSCKGESWEGQEGINKCSQLFNQILSTFKFIK